MDEDGVDVVEAIDAWIDEQIDDLTDDELEVILEILDAVSASSLANVDADDIYDDDIAELVELAGGSSDDRAYTDTVLRDALLGESHDNNVDVAKPISDENSDDDDLGDDDLVDDDDHDLDDDDLVDDDDHHLDDSDLADDDKDVDAELEDLDDDDLADDDDYDLDDWDLVGPDDAVDSDEADDFDIDGGFLSDLADAEGLDEADLAPTAIHDGFLADLAGATQEPTTTSAASVAPVELRDFDELGPSFLSEVNDSSRRSGRRSRRRLSDILLPAFMIVGLAAFAYGMVQLIDSLNEDEAATELASADQEPTATAVAEPTAAPTEAPTPASTVDPSEPTPTAAPEPTPEPRIGIRLVTGDIMVASFPLADGLPEISQVYDVSDEELAPARQVTWLPGGLGVVDANGNVLFVDPDARNPEPTIIYEAGGGFDEAVKISAVDDQVAVLTDSGDITLTPSNGRADPDVIQVAWDAAEEGAKATDLSSVDGFVPFVLDNGNAQMIVVGNDNAVVPIWVADEQPAAFNVGGSPTGILLGVGQGAVARYNFNSDSDTVLESVWDPFSREDEPAIGYSSAGAGTAIVTGDGAIVLADESGGGPLLWDPELTEIRAFIALGTDTQVVVLLETGSVVRIPIDPDELIESIWDITDETLSPANQVIVEPAEG